MKRRQGFICQYSREHQSPGKSQGITAMSKTPRVRDGLRHPLSQRSRKLNVLHVPETYPPSSKLRLRSPGAPYSLECSVRTRRRGQSHRGEIARTDNVHLQCRRAFAECCGLLGRGAWPRTSRDSRRSNRHIHSCTSCLFVLMWCFVVCRGRIERKISLFGDEYGRLRKRWALGWELSVEMWRKRLEH